MQFGKLLFAKRVPTSYSHLVMQYYGCRARPGGGLFVLDEPGRSLACRDILDGRLAGGCVLEPRLSFDAKRIVFSFVADAAKQYDPAVIVERPRRGLLPRLRSERRRHGPAAAHPRPVRRPDADVSARRRDRVLLDAPPGLRPMLRPGLQPPVARLHAAPHGRRRRQPPPLVGPRHERVVPDGVAQRASALRPMGLHRPRRRDAPEPVVDAARRHEPASPSGATRRRSRIAASRPSRSPARSKIVFTASAHHSITAGSICVVDPSVSVDGQEAITRVTPEVPFPEAETQGADGYGELKEYYASPWPLSEKYFLVAYSADAAGVRAAGGERSGGAGDLPARRVRQPRVDLSRPGDRQHESLPAGRAAHAAGRAERPCRPTRRRWAR